MSRIHTPLLKKIIQLLEEDGRVVAAWLEGSIARGEEDDISDIDLWIAVKDRQLKSFIEDRENFAAQLGASLSVLYPREVDEEDVESFQIILEDQPITLSIDVDVQSTEKPVHFIKGSDAQEYRVLFDRGKIIKEKPFKVEEVEEYVRTVADDVLLRFWHFLPRVHGLALRNDRIESTSQYMERLEDLVTLYRIHYTPEKIDWGFKDIEYDLPKEVIKTIYDLMPSKNAKKYNKFLQESNIEITKPFKVNWLKIIIISLISGIIGGLISNQLNISKNQYPQEQVKQKSEKTQEPKAKPIIIKKPKQEFDIQKLKAVVGIYKTAIKSKQKDIINEIIPQSNFLGNGIILTSDGWIATPQDIIENEKDITLLFANKTYKIPEERIIDPITKTVFFKINAQNLPVTPLNFNYNIKNTEDIAIVNMKNEFRITKIFKKNKTFHNQKSYIHNTENFYNFPTTEKLNEIFFGAPVYNKENQIIGFIMQNNENESLIQPISRLQPILKNIFKNSYF